LNHGDSKPNCYHLDTNYLIHYLTSPADVNHPDADKCRLARNVIGSLQRHQCDLKISVISIGEFVNLLVRDNLDENLLYDFKTKLENKDLGICLMEERGLSKFLELISEIRKGDNRIGTTDLLIAAHSMVDEGCCGLLTFDGALHRSVGISAIMGSLGRKFGITDDPR
jgi:hypothetical protein